MNSLKLTSRILVLCFFFSCQKEEIKSFITTKGGVFGTSYKMVYESSTNYQQSIDSLFSAINKSLSTYIQDSDISKINNGDTIIKVDNLFKEVFLKSEKIFKETNGYFDPTVGNLVNAYGFGPEKEIKKLSDEELKNQMKYVGFQKLKLINDKISKEHPNIYLDFNSIAKGFGVDVVARFFNSKNIKNYLIEIGGEIRTSGLKKNSKPWTIKIVNPLKSDLNEGFRIIDISNKSIATSGNYRKYRITDTGKKYVHTINPLTGLAQESDLLSVSVIADKDCADLDAYATAFMAMGFTKAKVFLQNHNNLDVIFLYLNKNNKVEEYTTYAYN